MTEFSVAQIEDLRCLTSLCHQRHADLVVVGAWAYKIHFPKKARYTQDIDFAIALDLDDFAELCTVLTSSGWTGMPGREHEWRTPNGARLDLLPVGMVSRECKQVVWPNGFAMSLVGFDHVFSKAVPVMIAAGLVLRVIPLSVLMLLKIVAFMDRPYERGKDLSDIRALLSEYEFDSDRIFTEGIGEEGVKEYSLANAFLLGRDLRALCTDDELAVIRRFIGFVGDESGPIWWAFVEAGSIPGDGREKVAREHLRTFADAFLAL